MLAADALGGDDPAGRPQGTAPRRPAAMVLHLHAAHSRRQPQGADRHHLGQRRDDVEPRKILVTNRVHWEVCRISAVYRYRWTGTETFHRDGKQELGMGDCQLRDGQGQTRHMYLVMLAYSLLMRQLRQNRAQEWALRRLTTIGEACRAMLHETLRATLAWVVQQVREHGKDA